MDHSAHDMSGMDMSGMDMSGMDHSAHGGHSMAFSTGNPMNLWLKSWVVDSDSDSGKYAGAIIGLILIAILNEFLVMIRVKLHQAYYPCGTKFSCNEDGADIEDKATNRASQKRTVPTVLDEFADATRPAGRVVITAMYTINVFLGYLLMLAAMTMDVGMFFAVVLGLGAGHFLFFRKPSREMNNLLNASMDGCGCSSQ